MNIAVILSGYPKSYKKSFEVNQKFYKALSSVGDVSFHINTYNYNFNYHSIEVVRQGKCSSTYRPTPDDLLDVSELKRDLTFKFNPKSLQVKTYSEIKEWVSTYLPNIPNYSSLSEQSVNKDLAKLYPFLYPSKFLDSDLSNIDLFIFTKLDQAIYFPNDINTFVNQLKENCLYTSSIRITKSRIKLDDLFMVIPRTAYINLTNNILEKIVHIFTPSTFPNNQLQEQLSSKLPYWAMYSNVDVRVIGNVRNRGICKDLVNITNLTFTQLEDYVNYYESVLQEMNNKLYFKNKL